MIALLHPTYFPNIAHFAAMAQAKHVVFEMDDNYQKQTYRNRTYIYAANGKLLLNIPIIHTQKQRQKYRDVKIANHTKWQLLHWKSLESAYRTSPFFEFYEDEFKPLFHLKTEFILDFNLKCFEVVCNCLQLDLKISNTEIYSKTTEKDITDFRLLANARTKEEPLFSSYNQVFGNKHGYINNLSVLDLLFNEGTNALNYLESQTLKI